LSTVNGQDLKQQINIPTDISAITIDPQGKVTGRTNSSSDPVDLGQIELSTFQNPEGLTPIGNNLYVSSAQTGTSVNGHPGDDGFGTLTQGSLEASNVSLSEELVNLVVAQRAYEMSAKVIQTSDEMLSISNNLRR
jgi:flagellar basal-body rod protein FlgG